MAVFSRDSIKTSVTGSSHPQAWQARLWVSLVILALAVLSLVIRQIAGSFYWTASAWIVVLDGLLCITLAIILKRLNVVAPLFSWSRVLLQWIGVFAFIYLISILVNRHAVTTEVAGLFALMLLALTLYQTGLYADRILIWVGIAIALMIVGTLFIKAYFWLVVVPLLILIVLFILFLIERDRRYTT